MSAGFNLKFGTAGEKAGKAILGANKRQRPDEDARGDP